MGGYVKLYRSIEQWEWYTDIPTKTLFLHCLIKANHRPNKWHGITIEPGTFVTSYSKLARETGLSVKQVRTALNHLKSTSEVAHETTSEYSVITIVKWSDYQVLDDEQGTPEDMPMGNQRASEGQAKGKQRATNNNDKNTKNEKNDKEVKNGGHFTPPTLDQLKAFILENGYDLVDPQRFMDYYISVGWKVGRNSMKDWKATVRQWQAREKERKPGRFNRIVEPIPDYDAASKSETKVTKKMTPEEIEELKATLKAFGAPEEHIKNMIVE